MKKRIVAAILMLLPVLVISGALTCGDSSTSEQTEGVEIQTLPFSDAEPFYRFDEPPVLVAYQAPDYPEEARRKDLEGSVMVKVLVGADGKVEETAILDSTDPVFDGPALEAAARCEFEPAKLEGAPTKSRVAIPYQFRLRSTKAKE